MVDGVDFGLVIQFPIPRGLISMARKIYVGNLPWSTTSADLEAMFAPHGAVRSAEVISDRETGRSRGFGFVEMETDDGLQAAINALNGQEINGRPLTVNEARERTPRPGGGGGGGGGRGGYGGGGGGRGGYGGGGGGGYGGGGGRGGYGGGGDRY
jgi:RNA recognition motif-containing protein